MSKFDQFMASLPGTAAHRRRETTLKLAADFIEKVKKKKDILVELQQTTNSLTKKDIGKWRLAWEAAINFEQPSRGALLGVYEDAMIDLHLTGAIGQRKGETKQKPFVLSKGDKEDDKARLIFEREWFVDFVDLALDASFWGHSLIQFGDIVSENGVVFFDGVELVPRKHVVPRVWSDHPGGGRRLAKRHTVSRRGHRRLVHRGGQAARPGTAAQMRATIAQ